MDRALFQLVLVFVLLLTVPIQYSYCQQSWHTEEKNGDIIDGLNGTEFITSNGANGLAIYQVTNGHNLLKDCLGLKCKFLTIKGRFSSNSQVNNLHRGKVEIIKVWPTDISLRRRPWPRSEGKVAVRTVDLFAKNAGLASISGRLVFCGQYFVTSNNMLLQHHFSRTGHKRGVKVTGSWSWTAHFTKNKKPLYRTERSVDIHEVGKGRSAILDSYPPNQKRSKVQGMASTNHMGATVLSGGETIEIAGMKRWPKGVNRSRVTVTGILHSIKYHPPVNGMYAQQRTGDYKKIFDCRWRAEVKVPNLVLQGRR